MPVNYQALVRYRVINRCLRDFQYSSIHDLKEACQSALSIKDIGLRTIEGDIHEMRYNHLLGYHAPIIYNKFKGAYSYSDPDYSIEKIPLNDDEINSILFAARLLEQYSNIGIFNQFADSARKIAEAVNVYREFHEETYSNAIEFENAVYCGGTEYLNILIKAIIEMKAVRLIYRSFTSTTSTEHLIHPYLLKEYRNRWYLIGYNVKYKAVRTYCLDRFEHLKTDERMSFLKPDFDAKEYYRNVIGISVLNGKPQEIEIAFSELQAQYIITQPLHMSQRKLRTENGMNVFGFRLIPNFEFISYIMGLGSEAVVLKPHSLKMKIKKALRDAAANY